MSASPYGTNYILPLVGVLECDLLPFVMSRAPVRTRENPRGSAEERFVYKVADEDITSDDPFQCWNWTGAQYGSGYGALGSEHAHRAGYKLFVGPIARGLMGCHRCDNRNCVRPSHIFLGSQKDNMADASDKGRLPHGATHRWTKLTTEQALNIRRSNLSCVVLARAYGVNQSTIFRIKNNERRKNG